MPIEPCQLQSRLRARSRIISHRARLWSSLMPAESSIGGFILLGIWVASASLDLGISLADARAEDPADRADLHRVVGDQARTRGDHFADFGRRWWDQVQPTASVKALPAPPASRTPRRSAAAAAGEGADGTRSRSYVRSLRARSRITARFDGVCSGLRPAGHPASPERAAPDSSGCLAPPARRSSTPDYCAEPAAPVTPSHSSNPSAYCCAGPNAVTAREWLTGGAVRLRR